MEADWEIEVGGSAPVIDACWAGFIDLGLEPERAATLPEASGFPELAQALVRLNAAVSPVWTSKSDVWEEDNFDPDEMDASPEDAASALACYVDLLPRTDQEWRIAEQAVAVCKTLCGRLRQVRLLRCRADLVVRLACIASDVPGHGVTAYLSACGPTLEKARATLGAALVVFVGSILTIEDAAF